MQKQIFQEISKNRPCPCGSGKVYGKCCRKKKIRYGIVNGKMVRQIPANSEVTRCIRSLRSMFQNYYGRAPQGDEFVLSFDPIYNDRVRLDTVYAMRKIKMPEDKIYAFYKTDGLMPSSKNVSMLSQKDINEYKEKCKEYRRKICEPVEGQINILQLTAFADRYLEKIVSYSLKALTACLNNFIRRHSRKLRIYEFKMQTELDYCMFSALKTIKTLESIGILKEEYLTECIYALARGIFENYMYLCAINREETFFEERLWRQMDEENYRFATKKDGTVDYRRIIHIKTGEEQKVGANNTELQKRLPYQEDKELYRVFYTRACWYVHVDVLSAQSYFAVTDPYEEIDPSLIAGLITVVLTTLLLNQLRKNRFVQPLFRRDAAYLCRKLNKKAKRGLEIAGIDPEHPNAVLDLLIRRIDLELKELREEE